MKRFDQMTDLELNSYICVKMGGCYHEWIRCYSKGPDGAERFSHYECKKCLTKEKNVHGANQNFCMDKNLCIDTMSTIYNMVQIDWTLYASVHDFLREPRQLAECLAIALESLDW